MDEVFLLLPRMSELGMSTLEWAFDHFDSDKTKLILVARKSRDDPNKSHEFMDIAGRRYLPKCAERKFRAEVLIPQKDDENESISELLHKHGMRKFVTWANGWSRYNLSTSLLKMFNKSCNIWIVNPDKTLALVSGHGAITQIMTEGTARDNGNLLSQIESIKKEKEEKEHLYHSLQSDYIKIKDERDNAVKEAKKLRNQINLARTSDFTWQELKKATQGFSESSEIGRGGYGRVYRGDLRGTDVAIKILNSQSTIPLSAFKREVTILTTVRHPNLVTLMGACYEHSALVYEFLPNGSLENHLNPANNTTPLTWQLRTRIISEICLALIFLHSNKPKMVIHGDLKPDNVFLDANFVSKLGDFGISRLIKPSDTSTTAYYETSNTVGTPGYMDPRYVATRKLTTKSDVFSFGVIIIRLITGKPVEGLVRRVEKAIQIGRLQEMIDVSAGDWPLDQAMELTLLGLRCAQIEKGDRPNLFNEVWPIVEKLRRNLQQFFLD